MDKDAVLISLLAGILTLLQQTMKSDCYATQCESKHNLSPDGLLPSGGFFGNFSVSCYTGYICRTSGQSEVLYISMPLFGLLGGVVLLLATVLAITSHHNR